MVSNSTVESLILLKGNGLLRNDPKFPPILLQNRKTSLPPVVQLRLIPLLPEREGDTTSLLQIKGEKRDGEMGDPQPVPAALGGTSNPSF